MMKVYDKFVELVVNVWDRFKEMLVFIDTHFRGVFPIISFMLFVFLMLLAIRNEELAEEIEKGNKIIDEQNQEVIELKDELGEVNGELNDVSNQYEILLDWYWTKTNNLAEEQNQ